MALGLKERRRANAQGLLSCDGPRGFSFDEKTIRAVADIGASITIDMVVVIAERAGLDLTVVAEAIATGQAASPQVVRNSRRALALLPTIEDEDGVARRARMARDFGALSPAAQADIE